MPSGEFPPERAPHIDMATREAETWLAAWRRQGPPFLASLERLQRTAGLLPELAGLRPAFQEAIDLHYGSQEAQTRLVDACEALRHPPPGREAAWNEWTAAYRVRVSAVAGRRQSAFEAQDRSTAALRAIVDRMGEKVE